MFDRASEHSAGVLSVLDVMEAARFGASKGWRGCGSPTSWNTIAALISLDRLADKSTVDTARAVSISGRRYRLSAALAEAVSQARMAGRAHRFGGITVAMVIGAIGLGDSPVANTMRAAAGPVDLPVAIARALADPGLSIMVGLMVDPAGSHSMAQAIVQRMIGCSVAAAGVAVAAAILFGIGIAVVFGVGSSLLYPIGTVGLLMAGAAIRTGARARAKSRRQLAANAVHALVTDPREPVLYLRAFDTDRSAGRIGESGTTATFSGVPVSRTGNLAQTRFTEEEQLARALSHVGPVVAIGRPGEALPFAGAARLYVGDTEWHDVVVELMTHAALVVVGLSRHTGVLWELRQAVERLEPSRLVLLVTTGVGEYEATCEQTADVFPVPLPAPVVVAAEYQVTIRAAIMFADDWTPMIVPFASAGFTPRMPVEWGCIQALRPVFERIAVTWPGRRWRYRLRGYLPHAIVAGCLAAAPFIFFIVLLIATAPR